MLTLKTTYNLELSYPTVYNWVHYRLKAKRLDTENFQQLIDALSVQLGEDIAMMQLDQSGAHVTAALRSIENLIAICQPAHSPELNPIRAGVAIYQSTTQR
jgi:hypothetical protein